MTHDNLDHLCVSDQHHPVHLVCLLPLLVDEGELDVEPVSDGGHPLGAARVRTADSEYSTGQCGRDVILYW